MVWLLSWIYCSLHLTIFSAFYMVHGKTILRVAVFPVYLVIRKIGTKSFADKEGFQRFTKEYCYIFKVVVTVILKYCFAIILGKTAKMCHGMSDVS